METMSVIPDDICADCYHPKADATTCTRRDCREIGVQCPGCGAFISIDNAGGYQTYCETCVDAMPPLPKDGRAYLIIGHYPDFKWVTDDEGTRAVKHHDTSEF